MYAVVKKDGYICGIVSGASVTGDTITADEHSHIRQILGNMPSAPSGYGYRLREDLEWELYALPPSPPEIQAEATEADYIAALGELGVAL